MRLAVWFSLSRIARAKDTSRASCWFFYLNNGSISLIAVGLQLLMAGLLIIKKVCCACSGLFVISLSNGVYANAHWQRVNLPVLFELFLGLVRSV